MRTAILCVLLTAGVVQAQSQPFQPPVIPQQPYVPTPPGPFPPEFQSPLKPTQAPTAPAATDQNSHVWGFLFIAGLIGLTVWALTRPPKILRWGPPLPPQRPSSGGGGIWLLIGVGFLLFYFLTR
jgi:hypothetical protein